VITVPLLSSPWGIKAFTVLALLPDLKYTITAEHPLAGPTTIKIRKAEMAPISTSVIDEFEIFTRKDPNQEQNTKYEDLRSIYGPFIAIVCHDNLLTITTFSRINEDEIPEKKDLLAEMEKLGLMSNWVIIGVFSLATTPEG
jgi:hypothetical protein